MLAFKCERKLRLKCVNNPKEGDNFDLWLVFALDKQVGFELDSPHVFSSELAITLNYPTSSQQIGLVIGRS